MRIPAVSDENIAQIKKNLPLWVDDFQRPPREWLEERLGRPLFEETRYEFPDFSLDMMDSVPQQTDAMNARIVYESMRSLPETAAADERLWVGMCLGPFWDCAAYRLSLDKSCTENALRENLFFAHGGRRSLMRNVLSRLWWTGYFTHDDTQVDEWKYTNFACETREYMVNLLERNTSNNITILRPFVDALLDARREDLVIDRNSIRELSKYLNFLGGVRILDCTPEVLIHDKILARAREVCPHAQNPA